MGFAIISVLALLGVALRLTVLHYQASLAPAGDGPAPKFSWDAYGKWLGRRSKEIFGAETGRKTVEAFESFTGKFYPGWMKWVFAGFVLCFLYLAASGFFYALFIPRGMFGLPLIAHVVLGGLYAVVLAFLLPWRARDYRFDKNEEAVLEQFACPIFKNLSRSFVRKILFWIFAVGGLLIIVTALLSMLPILPADAQKPLLVFHKYGALVAVLAAIIFADLTFLPAKRP